MHGGERAAGTRGSQGAPTRWGGVFLVVPQRRRSKVSTTGRFQTHCSVSDGWDRPQGCWATKRGPCPRGHGWPSPPPAAQTDRGAEHTQSWSTSRCSSPDSARKACFHQNSPKAQILIASGGAEGTCKTCCCLAAAAQGRASGQSKEGSPQPGAPHTPNTQGSAARQPLWHPQMGHGPQQRDAAVPESQTPSFPSPPGTPRTADGCRRSRHRAFPHATSCSLPSHGLLPSRRSPGC